MPTILFLTGIQEPRAVGEAIAQGEKARWTPDGEMIVVRSPAPVSRDVDREGETAGAGADVEYRFIFHTSVPRAVAEANRRPVDLIVVDNRVDPRRPRRTFAESPAGRLLPILSATRRDFRPVSRRHVVLLVGSGESLAADVYVAGAMKLGGYVVDPFGRDAAREGGGERFVDQIALMLGTRRAGKLALCLAGGGIEGLIYELGALRAIDDFLVGRKLADFDIFCGVSAGAVIAAFLANGVPVDEVVAGLKDGTGSLDAVRRATLFTPNGVEIADRLVRLVRKVVRPRRGDVSGPSGRVDITAALLRFVPGGFFSGEPIKWYMEEQLTRPGRTNCFRQLPKELYIGATDQDSGRHVLFGEAGHRDVPISHAVRASTALIPFYPPEVIGGRYLVDGAYTRTTNFTVTIRHGARLVTIVNPFVPLLTNRPGAVDREGGVFAALQGLKALVHSRFEQSYAHLDELYPDVDFQVFMPEGEELEQLTGTLMKFFYRVEIAELAYEHTAAKIRRAMPAMAEDLRRHGLLLRDPADDGPVALSGTRAADHGPSRVPDVSTGAS
ncbi:MAG: patatin-like phospholipase family protein [Myxococcota bacterium]|nr:patatin-like phospholipase family protein [Myxococcota bacterium]